MLSNLNLSDIMSEEQRAKWKRASRVVEVIVIFGVLYGAGGVTGYWWRDNIAVERRAAMETAHRLELERMNKTYGESLATIGRTVDYVVGKVAQTAATVDSIAQTSETAANTAQKAATTAQRAVTQSKTALDKAGQVPEPTRDQINRSVQRANSAIKP